MQSVMSDTPPIPLRIYRIKDLTSAGVYRLGVPWLWCKDIRTPYVSPVLWKRPADFKPLTHQSLLNNLGKYIQFFLINDFSKHLAECSECDHSHIEDCIRRQQVNTSLYLAKGNSMDCFPESFTVRSEVKELPGKKKKEVSGNKEKENPGNEDKELPVYEDKNMIDFVNLFRKNSPNHSFFNLHTTLKSIKIQTQKFREDSEDRMQQPGMKRKIEALGGINAIWDTVMQSKKTLCIIITSSLINKEMQPLIQKEVDAASANLVEKVPRMKGVKRASSEGAASSAVKKQRKE